MRPVLTRSTLLLALLCLSAGTATAQPLAFTGVIVIDVEEGVAEPGMTVVVSGGRIAAVGEAGSVDIPDDATVIDAAEKYLIPGLWDMHTHLLWSTDASEHAWVDMPDDVGSWALWERYYSPALDLLVANGVTGIREMWGDLEVARRVREEAAAGDRLAPRMVVAGGQIDGPPAKWSFVAATLQEGRDGVDSLKAAGAAFIKVYSYLRPEVYQAVAERAKGVGVPFAGHVPWLVRASEASDVGQRSFEHLVGVVQGCSDVESELIATNGAIIDAISEEGGATADSLLQTWYERVLAAQDDERCRRLLRRLARNETWQVPTLVMSRGIAYQDDPAMAADERMRYVHPGWRASWLPENDPYRLSTEEVYEGYEERHRLHERKKAITGIAAEEGVPLLAGTDTPNAFAFPGFGLHDELELLVEAGLTPLEALQAATINPARFLGRTDDLGTVEEGRLADLVLLEANPLEDIANTRRIRAVVANGRYFDRDALDAMLAEVERVVQE